MTLHTRIHPGLLVLTSLVVFLANTIVSAVDKPNIVLIFIDDMGYGDIGPFGNTVNQTPHLGRMAREGLKPTQFYVSNTACTPSRSADRASMELYANEGRAVACSYEFETPQDYDLSISASKEVQINSLVVNELTSAWLAE